MPPLSCTMASAICCGRLGVAGRCCAAMPKGKPARQRKTPVRDRWGDTRKPPTEWMGVGRGSHPLDGDYRVSRPLSATQAAMPAFMACVQVARAGWLSLPRRKADVLGLTRHYAVEIDGELANDRSMSWLAFECDHILPPPAVQIRAKPRSKLGQTTR